MKIRKPRRLGFFTLLLALLGACTRLEDSPMEPANDGGRTDE